MPLGPFTLVAIYLTSWWIVLFVILPIGMSSQVGEPPKDGAQWGAPTNPNLKKKFITTTWVSAIVWVVIVGVVWLGLIPVPQINPESLPAL
ncbi:MULTISPECIES: DUF1467 family protein [unclassified Brevundimonas]|uniref:DUF1467 family protein n=1 Tax=unclassified Brevundimonas TaxID=2622653 RepID=UPI0025BB6EB6|nr:MULTISPECIES: DUF1467 family protein [unclassified Brevundimonas]